MAYLSVFPIPSESTHPMVLRIMARFGVLFLFAFATPLFADSVTINFEGFADGTVITTQYTGLGFLNATIATAGVSLDELDFPPHSGVNAFLPKLHPLLTSNGPSLSLQNKLSL
jgi:hypothetical protein